LMLFRRLRVVIVLGKIAFDSFLAAYQANGGVLPKPRPKFGHGISLDFPDGLRLICSYHPSQQNTFTGRLTEQMLDAVMNRAHELASG
jgi:uracil-DNA glycosylase